MSLEIANQSRIFKFVNLILIGVTIIRGIQLVSHHSQTKTNGFASYYTASHIFVHQPDEMKKVYDDSWFVRQLNDVGFNSLYDIYNIQPPTMSLIFVPFSLITPESARILWTIMNLLFLFIGLGFILAALDLPLWIVLPLFSFSTFFVPTIDNFRNGQVYLLLFLFLSIFVYGFLKGEIAISGVSLGLMLILKTAGIWLLPLLLAIKKWRIIGTAVSFAVIIAVSSILHIGFIPWVNYFELLPSIATDPRRYVTAYQTLISLIGHPITYSPPWSSAPIVNLPGIANILILCLLMLALGVSIVLGSICYRYQSLYPLMIGMFVTLIVTNTPYAEGHHYVLILPSILIGIYWAVNNHIGISGYLLLIIAIFLIGGPLPYRSQKLTMGWLALLAYPRVYGAYLLWVWYCWMIIRYLKEIKFKFRIYRLFDFNDELLRLG